MKIDEKRQANKVHSDRQMTETTKRKIPKEVKNIDFGSNFKSNGTRSKGEVLLFMINEGEYCLMECEGAKSIQEKSVDQKLDSQLESRCLLLPRNQGRRGY